MRYWINRALLLYLTMIFPLVGWTQSAQEAKVDLLMGAELNYRDLFHNKVYEVLVNLTPGVKWYMGNQWQLAGQAIVPVYNDYGARYKRIRLNMAVLSKEWDLNGRHFFKASSGLFGGERYGLDIKWMYPVNSWLALDMQAGFTGYCSMAVGWECSRMERLTGQGGVNIYIEKVNTEFRLHGGRYVYEDYGVRVEAMRHFRHCTVGLYAQYNDKEKETGGFKIVMMIPPYKRKTNKVNIRPASNFRLTYEANGLPYAVRMYTTDPEENEREGHFDRQRLRWGANCMEPDFKMEYENMQ